MKDNLLKQNELVNLFINLINRIGNFKIDIVNDELIVVHHNNMSEHKIKDINFYLFKMAEVLNEMYYVNVFKSNGKKISLKKTDISLKSNNILKIEKKILKLVNENLYNTIERYIGVEYADELKESLTTKNVEKGDSSKSKYITILDILKDINENKKDKYSINLAISIKNNFIENLYKIINNEAEYKYIIDNLLEELDIENDENAPFNNSKFNLLLIEYYTSKIENNQFIISTIISFVKNIMGRDIKKEYDSLNFSIVLYLNDSLITLLKLKGKDFSYKNIQWTLLFRRIEDINRGRVVGERSRGIRQYSTPTETIRYSRPYDLGYIETGS